VVLAAKEQVAELSESQEEDEEHYSEAGQVLGTLAQSRRQLGHRAVETDVLEDLSSTSAINHQQIGNCREFFAEMSSYITITTYTLNTRSISVGDELAELVGGWSSSFAFC